MNEVVAERPRWDLAAESIVVKIRWFGVIMGYVLVQSRTGLHNPSAVRAFLALGAGYAALDFAFWRLGKVFLRRWPLFVSFMESIFIALLCYHDTGLASPFRWYYLLSLICCAIRYQPAVAWWTLGFHSISLLSLAWSLNFSTPTGSAWPLTLVIMAWVTWASSALAGLLKAAGDQLQDLNSELVRVRAELEERVAERTDALRTSQARMIQQEKMAAFGLLAAGIAHEVGNPLAVLSSLVQILKRRGPDPYTSEKLDLAGRQLHRIERTIRELIDFSRPASRAITRTRICEVVDEAPALPSTINGPSSAGSRRTFPRTYPRFWWFETT
jgi:signal transduction histidine kinase